MLRVVPVDAAFLMEALEIVIDKPIIGYVGIDGDRIVGSGGLAWGAGRCWIWLDTSRGGSLSSVQVVRWAKRMLRKAAQLGETEVWTPRDDRFASSAKLLTLLGFEQTDETDTLSNKSLWVWRKKGDA